MAIEGTFDGAGNLLATTEPMEPPPPMSCIPWRKEPQVWCPSFLNSDDGFLPSNFFRSDARLFVRLLL